ncbi:MAG TPA: DUF2917 domain-containing protein [Burkholderiales bacterium]|nr:DUF2917 domain-containing protein [Burkholderiales bacterium]
MNIELQSGAVQLTGDQTLKLRDGAGATVCAVQGTVWITEENEPRDIVLAQGNCYRLRHAGVAVINALGGGAAVAFT